MVTDDKEQPVESHRLFELGEYVRMKTNDLTQGSIGKGFVLFAIPLFLGSLFQQLYNTVDMLFVGNVLGKNAAAAVGASSILVTCLINLVYRSGCRSRDRDLAALWREKRKRYERIRMDCAGGSCGRTNPYGDRCDLFPSSISQASHAS